jgi:predicted nuclease of predicted toxin-antitoxin system
VRILVDENIPKRTVDQLRADGNDVLDLRNTPKEGISDDDIWNLVKRQKRLLITTDKGFLTRRQEMHFGLLVVLLRQPNSQKINQKIFQAFQHFDQREWLGRAVVMRDRVMTTWKRKADEEQ